jgi:formate dehydrogenase major subunit
MVIGESSRPALRTNLLSLETTRTRHAGNDPNVECYDPDLWADEFGLRGAIEARALVSRRMRPMHLNGKTVHQIAMPFHFGSAGPVKGGTTNDLVPISGEPNVTIMEAKALTCNIVPGRLPRGPAFEDWLDQYVPKGGPANLHPEQPPAGAPCARAGGGHGLEGKIDNR